MPCYVDYDNTVPEHPYWIMLNSWGTAYGERPNGIFLVDMDMDYSCWFQIGEYSYPNFDWYTLDIDYDLSTTTSLSWLVAVYCFIQRSD
jgi:hypothetical protein